ncbi:unnamed protein product [Penicillium nalgiovense]|nr:unnamed protein product [Penicillium nalgiovense]
MGSAIDPQNKGADYYNLGTYHRPINTTVSDAQLWFDRGLQWSYSFNHEEGARCFKTAAESDPNCAMAYWGLAYALGPNYNKAWSRFDQGDLDETVETASVALKLAQELSQKPEKAPVEYALIKALAARFPVKGMPLDLNALNHAYVNEMRSVYNLSPEDPDVVALFTEALMCTRPRDLWNVKTGEPARCTVEARQALEPAMARKGGMEHPAFCHLYIHLMEMSPFPEIALKAADSLRRVVPDGSHLLHMASHIDIACGDYRAALMANDAAILADNKFFAREQSSVLYTMYRAHNAYAKSFAAIMLGNFTEALSAARVVGEILTPSLLSVTSPPLADWAEAYLGVLPHVLVRFGRWNDILQLDLPEDKTLLCSTVAMVHYAKGIALSVLGRIEEAQQILLQFRAAHAAVPASRLGSLPSREIDVLQVAAAMLEGELEYRKGRYSLAFSSLRKAVELEDALPYADPPAWIQPSRHALGALLLEQNHVRFCMPGIQVAAAITELEPIDPLSCFTWARIIAAVSSTSGYQLLSYSKLKPPGANWGRYTRQSPRGSSNWRARIHARAWSIVCVLGDIASHSPIAIKAVSQTGETQAWILFPFSSSQANRSNAWNPRRTGPSSSL